MNSNSERRIANAIGGKTARSCDSCLKKRARWFSTADDAFLCQTCDGLVHSANLLASRHERVRLETSSLKGSTNEANSSVPTWHRGFTRKARTPRQPKHMKLQTSVSHPLPFVPEINGDETCLLEENDEQLLYRVPVFDPIADVFLGGDTIESIVFENEEIYNDLDLDKLLKGDDELEVFATDVDSLLGMGIEKDSSCGVNNLRMETFDCEREENEVDELLYRETIKVKEEEDGEDEEEQAALACHFDPSLDMEFNWEFNYASSMSTWEDEDEMKTIGRENKTIVNIRSESGKQVERKMLRLNYEAVIAAWSTRGSPWTNGIRPQFDLDKFSVACLGVSHQYGGDGGRTSVDNAGRQARVSRYREKRRTRLFAKKIRYEVRKLNAEKRPRMKGRFVKRTSLSTSSSLPTYFKNK